MKSQLALACAALLVPTLVLGGPLDPPLSVESTNRFGNGVEISPSTTPGGGGYHLRITESGYYYLGQNLSFGDQPFGLAVSGLEITAEHVTIDLGGFLLENTGFAETDGIILTGNSVTLTIRNGTIRGFKKKCVAAGAGAIRTILVDDVHFEECGLALGGASHMAMRNSTIRTNDGSAIDAPGGAPSVLVDGCLIRVDTNLFVIDSDSTARVVVRNTILRNLGSGDSISTFANALVVDSIVD